MPVYIGTPISGTIFIGKVKLLKQNKLPDFPKFIDKKQVDDELNKCLNWACAQDMEIDHDKKTIFINGFSENDMY